LRLHRAGAETSVVAAQTAGGLVGDCSAKKPVAQRASSRWAALASGAQDEKAPPPPPEEAAAGAKPNGHCAATGETSMRPEASNVAARPRPPKKGSGGGGGALAAAVAETKKAPSTSRFAAQFRPRERAITARPNTTVARCFV